MGIYNGCTAEWGAPSSGWGAQYGGISSRSDCDSFPEKLKAGCQWRFDWFGGSDNPGVTFEQVSCPAALTAITGCVRADDGSAAPPTSASSSAAAESKSTAVAEISTSPADASTSPAAASPSAAVTTSSPAAVVEPTPTAADVPATSSSAVETSDEITTTSSSAVGNVQSTTTIGSVEPVATSPADEDDDSCELEL